MDFLINVLIYVTCIKAIVSILLAIRYRNYIDVVYLLFLFGMAGGGISSVKNHFVLGMVLCSISMVIVMMLAVLQVRERIGDNAAF